MGLQIITLKKKFYSYEFSTVYKNKKSCLNFPQNFALIKLVEKKLFQVQKVDESTPLTKKKSIEPIQTNFEPITAFTLKNDKSNENLTNTSDKGEKGGILYVYYNKNSYFVIFDYI